MEPRLRIAAWVTALITAAAAGYAVGLTTDETGGDPVPPPPSHRFEHGVPPDRPASGAGAADEYELSSPLPRR